MATSNSFVIAIKANNSVLYSALDSRDSVTKSENPMSFKKFFSHDDATAIVRAMRAKGLEEGVEVRVKSLAQSVRDYSWTLVQKSQTVELIDAETLEKVLKRYPAKKAEAAKPVETETNKEVPVESVVEVEVAEAV